ncbi:hypothetical protein CW712_02025 [Candidatus Bathyarchaeota archaeon]|nr:MAG: hypothetical protein CW712_02025 [Candidatus Bathyarchaeota archaeon]
MEEEKIRKIAQLRETLEERVKTLETELDGLRALLDFINDLLIEKSFKRAEEIAKPSVPAPEVKPKPAPPREQARTVLLKTGSGEPLANLYIKDGQMRIVPMENKVFNVNTPPFTAFLVERIFAKMREKDQELVNQGKLVPEKAFSYKIRTDGKIIKEIIIRNFVPQREREIQSATRWTLEKMYEKTRGSTKTV